MPASTRNRARLRVDLTIAPGGVITSTNLFDVRTVPVINGNLSLPSSITVAVDPVTVDASVTNGGVTNGQIGLAINANLAGPGGAITKTGSGVLSLGGVSTVANNVSVSAGTLVLGTNANYNNFAINVGASGTLDMRGQANIQVGSISGAGIIRNFHVSTPGTLILGADHANAQFDGTLTGDYTTGALNITKIGTGSWTLTADSRSQILGTLRYLAPEHFTRKIQDVDERADVYSLGAVMYELAAGENLFDGTTEARLMQQILSEEPPDLRALP